MDLLVTLGDWSIGDGPLHRKLAGALAQLVATGELVDGARLPSERALARRLVVSRTTVVAAYRTLLAEGLVETRHGSGTYVRGARRTSRRDADEPGRAAPIFTRLLAEPDPALDIVTFASAVVPPSGRLAEAFASVLADDLSALIETTGYQPLGVPALRDAVAAAMTRSGVRTTRTDLMVTTGAQQALNLCASLLVRPGDWVVLEDPTYPGCIDAFAAAGARFIPVGVDENGIIVEQVARALAERAPAAIAVTPTYHNPTGALLSDDRRRRLVELSRRYGVPIVEDHAWAFAPLTDDEAPPLIAAHAEPGDPPVFVIGSASKMFWSGLRTGWIRAPQPWLARLARRKVAADLGSAVFDQAVTARLFADVWQITEHIREVLAARRATCEQRLAEDLPGWTWPTPAGGPSLWAKMPHGDVAEFAQLSLRHGVEIIPGPAFSSDGRWRSHLRIPFSLDPALLDLAIARLAEAWRRYRPDGAPEAPLGEPALVV